MMAIIFLRGDEPAVGSVHRQHLSHDVLKRCTKAHFDPRFRQDSSYHCLFRTQLFLLLRQIPEEKTHHQEGDRTHKQPLRLKLGYIQPEQRNAVLKKQSVQVTSQSSVKESALDPNQQNRSGGGSNGLP